jgi:y4mF family transcriptional regulator
LAKATQSSAQAAEALRRVIAELQEAPGAAEARRRAVAGVAASLGIVAPGNPYGALGYGPYGDLTGPSSGDFSRAVAAAGALSEALAIFKMGVSETSMFQLHRAAETFADSLMVLSSSSGSAAVAGLGLIRNAAAAARAFSESLERLRRDRLMVLDLAATGGSEAVGDAAGRLAATLPAITEPVAIRAPAARGYFGRLSGELESVADYLRPLSGRHLEHSAPISYFPAQAARSGSTLGEMLARGEAPPAAGGGFSRLEVTSVRALGERVRRRRVELGLNQQQLAERAGVGRRFVSELEAGKATLEFGRVLKVCEAAGLRLVIA